MDLRLFWSWKRARSLTVMALEAGDAMRDARISIPRETVGSGGENEKGRQAAMPAAHLTSQASHLPAQMPAAISLLRSPIFQLTYAART